jgi:endoglucanase
MEKSPLPSSQAYGNSKIRRGINLGNALDAPSLGEWGVIIQPHFFPVIRNAGFDSVRIPVRFSAHASSSPPFILDDSFMKLVDEVVYQGLKSGLTVILDFHNYEEIMSDPAGHRERFLAIWQQLAERYQNAPDNLYFEVLNEPHFKLDAQIWNVLLNSAIPLIRESNPVRQIIIGGGDYSNVQALDQLNLPDDQFLIAAFHFYEPFEFTHQGASWVDGAASWEGTAWSGTSEEKQAILDQLDKAVSWSTRNKITLLMGEFGTIAKADADSRQKWTQFVAREAEKRNIGWVYWDFCAEFRVYDCQTEQWDSRLIRSLIPD